MSTISSHQCEHLYIIGNGFDLFHGINSSYLNFRDWLSVNGHKILTQLDEKYGECSDKWWSKFEEELALLEVLSLAGESAKENPVDLSSDHCDSEWEDAQYDVTQQLKSLFENLEGAFSRWIKQLNEPKQMRVEFQRATSKFINFNYTSTLEELYGVKPENILYIHGCADNNEKLIFGHGMSKEELEITNMRMQNGGWCDLDDKDARKQFYEYYTERELNEQLALNAAITSVAEMRKPVEALITKHTPFFKSISGARFVHVYGLSLSGIDMPYMKLIAKKCPSAQWEFSYHKDPEDLNRIKSFCQENKITNFKSIKLEDVSETRQLKLQF